MSIASLALSDDDHVVNIEVDVRNVGARSGVTVVQIYGGLETRDPDRPIKRLCGFRRVSLAENEMQSVRVDVDLHDLASFDPQHRRWQIRTGAWRFFAGSSSSARDLDAASLELPSLAWSIAGERI